MTSNDFAEWARYHGDAFPSLADWLEKHPETLKFWAKALDGVDVRDAKTATDEMASGRLDEPKGFGQHPKVIAARARQIGASRAASLRVVDGERVYDCPLCLDEGFVPVVDPVHFRRGTFRACFVFCTCAIGDRRAEARPTGSGKRRETPRFDKRRMFAIDRESPDSQQRAEFAAWLGGGRVVNLPGYEAGFDAWNEAG